MNYEEIIEAIRHAGGGPSRARPRAPPRRPLRPWPSASSEERPGAFSRSCWQRRWPGSAKEQPRSWHPRRLARRRSPLLRGRQRASRSRL